LGANASAPLKTRAVAGDMRGPGFVGSPPVICGGNAAAGGFAAASRASVSRAVFRSSRFSQPSEFVSNRSLALI